MLLRDTPFPTITVLGQARTSDLGSEDVIHLISGSAFLKAKLKIRSSLFFALSHTSKPSVSPWQVPRNLATDFVFKLHKRRARSHILRSSGIRPPSPA